MKVSISRICADSSIKMLSNWNSNQNACIQKRNQHNRMTFILTFIPFIKQKHVTSYKIYDTHVQVYLAIIIQTAQYIFTSVSVDVCTTRHSTLNPIDTRSLLLRAAWVHVIAMILASLINRYSAWSDPLLNNSKARNSCQWIEDSACMLDNLRKATDINKLWEFFMKH